MLKYKFFVIVLLLANLSYSNSNEVKVGLYYQQKVFTASIKIHRGHYDVYADKVLVKTVKKQDHFTITYKDSIEIKFNNKQIKAKQILVKGQDYVNNFSLKTSLHGQVSYDDDLEIRQTNSLQFINHVKLENYIAAVVEGEAGYNLPAEFYKLQAILSRTYALKNKNRHSNEGYSVCDKVHCQVYHHKCTKANIYEATVATTSLVVVDEELNLINTIFHSNCGGQTCNSEDVWNENLSYLRCVKDSFCLDASKFMWEKSFPKNKVDTYFRSHKGSTDSLNDLFSFCQDEERNELNQVLSIRLTKIRHDLGLRSTYFYAEEKGDSIVFFGKGYGHGVGLCQQGGIEMANRGYSYIDILKHYYQNIHILNRKALRFFKE